jgi:16S rRNA (guanine527-N7)-methyltransferase
LKMKNGEPRDQIELAVFSLIERGLIELATHADSEQVSQLTQLVMFVSEWAGRISLTGHRDPLEMAGQLVLDAAALSKALPELDTASRLVDLGSGVGFPGLPIAIVRPGLEVVLVESRLKRHHLQREARRRLDLADVVPLLGRSDEVDVRPSDVVVAQAMAQPAKALELMRPWARPGGLVALPASEESEAPSLPDGFEDLSHRSYQVPETGRLRKLWVARATPS